MRRVVGLVVVLGLVLGLAGGALAECGAGHSGTVSAPPEKPLPQS